MWFISSNKLASLADKELLLRYRKSGDVDMLGVLYNRHIHLVYAVSLKYLRNKEDSNDAVMEIFEKLVVEARRHEVHNFKGWLHVTTRNYCLMQLRKKKVPTAEINTEDIMEYSIEMHPVDEKNVEDDLQKMEKCLEELAEAQRKCVALFYLEQKSYKQVSASLGLEMKHVKSHIQNGKRNLKNCIENLSEEV